MGVGDELMATGMARGAAARGKLAAFGNRHRIIWGPRSKEIFAGNPNIAPIGSERTANGKLEWHEHYHGRRAYQRLDAKHRRWIWNFEFKAQPGELFFTAEEKARAVMVGQGFILIEPNVPMQKPYALNKAWPVKRYQEVANALVGDYEIIQLHYAGARHHLSAVRKISTATARDAFAILSRARLYIGPEGGMHHAAAALGVPGVVIFGGFIPPSVTGYAGHINLTGGADPCGTRSTCMHCLHALDMISVDEVITAARTFLCGRVPCRRQGRWCYDVTCPEFLVPAQA